MARFNNEEILNSVGLPSQLLQQIKNKENKGDYDDDESEDRFTKFENIRGTKRKSKPISRKDKRKQERELKKQKRIKKDTHPQKVQPKKQNEKTADPLALLAAKKNKSKSKKAEEDNPLVALRKLKENKNSKKTSKAKEDFKIVKEDELLEDEVSDLGYSEDDFCSENEEDFDEDENIDIDPMEALRALKEKKKGVNKASSDIRIVKEDDLEQEDDDISDFEELEEENDPLEALRLLKSKKNKPTKTSEIRIVKEDDLEQENDDDVSDLDSDENVDDQNEEGEDFEGFEEENFDESDFHLSEEEDPLAKLKAIKEAKKNGKSEKTKKKQEKEVYPIDPHLQEQFRKDDEDIEYYAKKLGLKNGKKAKLSKTDDNDIIGGLLDGLDLDFESEMENISDTADEHISEEDEEDDEYFSDDVDDSEKMKENPYVAPGSEETKSSEKSGLAPQRYIPPALRKKMALEAGESVSEETLKLRKSIKGPLNKLSEANISSIVSEINALYLSHPRQTLNEEITNIILDSIVQQGRLLDTFVYLHATVVVALYRLQGVEFGAHFIQTIVEKFETSKTESSKTKEASNIISLLSSVYLFQLVSSKLLYDLIKELINNLDENNADLLLRLIRNSGNQMRSDDPSALKEIVLLINGKASTLPKDAVNTRTQFLIETISSLKNNKLKIVNEANHQLSIKLKKFLGGINENKSGDPIQVSLEDIQNVATRGKWWLVGSAWKGHETDKPKDVDVVAMSDILDNAEPNWMELAKSQRMNTDIRRAIFVSIMSANDYIDAVTKLDKLALKRNQEREIPKVLIHCATMEPSWNPYYGVLGNKLCDSHSFRKTFQFVLWDLIKELDGGSADDEEEEDNFIGFDTFDEENKMKRILNLGRFYGFLLAEGSMPLHNLRTVNFLTASSDTVLFLEVLLVSFFDQVGKKSRKNSVGGGLQNKAKGMYEQKYDDRLLVERVLKAKDQTTMLRGLQYFVQEKVKTSEVVSGKKQSKRVAWGVDALFDIIDEFLKDSED
ncbi:hypothetical protein MGK_05728 [Candida albicans P57055]|nr:hypothetical protein MGK_05728 [Candida albicans P57055]